MKNYKSNIFLNWICILYFIKENSRVQGYKIISQISSNFVEFL